MATTKILVTVKPVVLEVDDDASEEQINAFLDEYAKYANTEWQSWKYTEEWRN